MISMFSTVFFRFFRKKRLTKEERAEFMKELKKDSEEYLKLYKEQYDDLNKEYDYIRSKYKQFNKNMEFVHISLQDSGHHQLAEYIKKNMMINSNFHQDFFGPF